MSALQAQRPEFKPNPTQKKKREEKENTNSSTK
jgi:hypothetical protein